MPKIKIHMQMFKNNFEKDYKDMGTSNEKIFVFNKKMKAEVRRQWLDLFKNDSKYHSKRLLLYFFLNVSKYAFPLLHNHLDLFFSFKFFFPTFVHPYPLTLYTVHCTQRICLWLLKVSQGVWLQFVEITNTYNLYSCDVVDQ